MTCYMACNEVRTKMQYIAYSRSKKYLKGLLIGKKSKIFSKISTNYQASGSNNGGY